VVINSDLLLHAIHCRFMKSFTIVRILDVMFLLLYDAALYKSLYNYNDAVPDGAERLLKMVENQSQHRIQMEERAVEGGLKNRDRGQIFAFIICVLALGWGIFLIHTNKNVSGLVIILGALGGIVSTFIIGSKGQKMKKELEIKGSKN
jgi:uncharacterized membrane protein